jgi:serine/threonine-protein kinase
MQVSPGAVIAGRYLVERKVGAGAMGEVWQGEHIGVGYAVAIKTMLAEGLDNPEVVERFKREALLLGRIRSDYVARILDFLKDPVYGHVLILDYIGGEVFSDTLRRTKLSVEEAVDIGTDIMSGLVDLHDTNIVHRDLKPSNIILEKRRDGKLRAIIVDFGVSRLMKKEGDFEELANLTRAGMMLGTLEYMAPEQMLESRNVTGASDLYAVGAMLFRAVAGAHVFGQLNEIELTRKKLLEESPPLVTGRSDLIAKSFEGIVSRALRKKPSDRYTSAEDMLKDLMALRDRIHHPAAAHGPMPVQPAIAPAPARPPPLPPGASGGARPPPLPNAAPAIQAIQAIQAPPVAPPPAAIIAQAPSSVRPPASGRSPVSVRPPASGRLSFDSIMPPPQGVSKRAVLIVIAVALALGLILGGLVLGSGT